MNVRGANFPWHCSVGAASLILALLVAWLIVSRVTQPLRALARAASEVGRSLHPEAIPRTRRHRTPTAGAEPSMACPEDLKRINAERGGSRRAFPRPAYAACAPEAQAELSIREDHARNAVIDDIEQMDAIIGQFLDFRPRRKRRGRNSPTSMKS